MHTRVDTEAAKGGAMSDATVATQQVPTHVLERAQRLFGMTNDELERALKDPWNLLVILDICEEQE